MGRRLLILLAGASAAATPLLIPAAAAQQPPVASASEATPEGDWVGVLQVDTAIHAGLHIRRENGTLAATVDVPEHGAYAIPLVNVTAQDGRLGFALGDGSGHYEGSWNAEKQRYVGAWIQQNGRFPLEFARGKLPPPPPIDWDTPPVAGLDYAPAPAARARTGPTLPVGKCINLSGMLEPPKEGDWGPAVADDDLQIIRAAGFSTVRIPVRWSAHAQASPPYAIDPDFLRRVHHVVDLAIASRLNVILNVHHYDELTADPAAHADRFAALWRQIARSFASAPKSVWFELLNEPHDKLTDANLSSVLAPALAAVRASNPTRPVLIGGRDWSNLQSLETLALPDDRYVVPTFHYYEPFAFTHQAASWVTTPPPLGRVYGSAADKALLDRSIERVRAYMARTGRVPVLGEYGAQDDPRVPVTQRIRYYHAISSAFASAGIQSCAWGYRTGFRLREGDHWIPGLLEAIETTRR